MLRTLIGSALVAALLGLVLLNTAGATAQIVPKDKPQVGDQVTHEGTVISVKDNKLVMRDKDKKRGEHTHKLAANAKVTCDGKTCVLSDLKTGMKVRVTTKKDDPGVATRVEALDKEKTFLKSGGGKGGGAAFFQEKGVGKKERETHEGVIVSVGKNKIIMKGKGDKAKEHTHTLSPKAKITCDAKTCVLSDLKTGLRVRVTTMRADPEVAVRIEALDKERNFEPTKVRDK